MSTRIDSVHSISEDAAATLETPLTLEIRAMAHGAGWPSRIVSELSIGYEDGYLVVNWPEALNEEVENLEYGDINSLPNAVIRPFIMRAQPDIKSVLERQSLGQLFVALGVV